MLVRRLLFLAILLALTGCARPGDLPINAQCDWIEDDHRTLDLKSSADRRHLVFDAVTAEDMAIRWADENYHLAPDYDQHRAACMDRLMMQLANNHQVQTAVVHKLSRERDLVFDSFIFLFMGVVYAFAAYFVAGRIGQRFAANEAGFWILILIFALTFSLVGLLLGQVVSIWLEEVRLNSPHLSYRLNRVPWRQHWLVVYLGVAAVFALATVVRLRFGFKSRIERPSLGGLGLK